MKAVKLYATLDTIRQNKSNFINSGMLIFLTCPHVFNSFKIFKIALEYVDLCEYFFVKWRERRKNIYRCSS